MSARIFPTKAQLDALLPQLEDCARAWVERECISFDDAVLNDPSKQSDDDGTIWDMPAIDSKRVTSLLEEFEQIIGGGCTIPVSTIKSGGYVRADDLVAKLLPRIRDKCADAHRPGLASTAAPPAAARSTPPRVLP